MKVTFALLVLVFSSLSQAAEDTIYLDDTVISGNQELPKVLYILPWKSMTPEALAERPLDDQPTNFLTPIYPESHRRELGYRQTIQELSKEKQQ